MGVSEAEIRAIVEKAIERVLSSSNGPRLVALGSDHGGYELKEAMKKALEAHGYEILDLGTHSKDSVDYPDFADAVGRAVASGEADRGIVIDTAGIGSAIAANKIPGVRAALCYNEGTIRNSRLHNDANVLTLGAAYHKPDEAISLALLWLQTEFEGGRHQRRIDKITALER